MAIDEMELLGRLADVEPLSAEAFTSARAALQSAIDLEPTPGLAPWPRGRRRSSRSALTHGAIGAGIAAVAAVVAVVATSGTAPSAPSGNAAGGAPAGTRG